MIIDYNEIHMESKKYSANMIKYSFWFSEFKKVMQLMNKGITLEEIEKMNIEENIFFAPTKIRAVDMFKAVSKRVEALHPAFYPIFELVDVSNQKIINLIAIMQREQLFFDFVYEVYREKIMLDSPVLEDMDIAVFFKNKQIESKDVAKWKDYTLKRLGAVFKTFLIEAGVISSEGIGEREILKPVLDYRIEDALLDNGLSNILSAMTGVR